MPEEHEQRLITLVRTKEQPWLGAVAGCVAAQDTARLDALSAEIGRASCRERV